MAERTALFALALLLTIWLNYVDCQVLTPPYFNLAVGRRVEASATCGEGVDDAELFCKLTGANPGSHGGFSEYNVIQGQLCDYCDNRRPNMSHPPDYAIDGTERWWQSPPLSRGLQFNQVNLTVHLGQEFHVAYVFIKMANSPRPGVFALERSTDNGITWKPWQYFADTPSDCHQFFAEEHEYTDRIEADDSVICTSEYSRVVPLEGGEIVVSLVNGRPSANNFSYAQTLQDWTKATTVRLRLLRTKTLLGHLMAVARQDPTVTRRYFYSVKDISIGGRCVCNGHAEVCDKTDPDDLYRLLCRCRHNTCGPQCNTCCPGFVQKPWKPATLNDVNECEPCNCHGHSQDCLYDEDVARNRESLDIYGNYEGGGVCQNCADNTEGINCETCRTGFYRPRGVSQDAPDACRPCNCDGTFSTGDCEDGTGKCICRAEYDGERCEKCSVGYFGWPRCQECECNVNGTLRQVCEVGGGQCPCKPNYEGYNCDRCAYGYYGFPDCKPCGCDSIGGSSSYCDVGTGQCQCNPNYGGRDCADCAEGYYGYPACQLCNCDPSGCGDQICDPSTGTCLCENNYGGLRCDRCNTGYYRHPFCIECQCMQPGSQSEDCDNGGQCVCQYNFAGLKCDRCAPGYYRYPECLACNCDTYGSYGVTCNQQSGQCDCMDTFEGVQCDSCKANYFNYPNCEECNCNPAGAKDIAGFPRGGCGSVRPGLLCECKERVNSKFCDKCNDGYWNLQASNPVGCETCGCDRQGTTGSQLSCSSDDGQCVCRPYVNSRQCDSCADGMYNLQDHNVFGCEDCECDAGGALDHKCDKDSGACRCRPRVNGRRCETPLPTHYVPTLYQHKYEMEDGHTPSGGPVRYGFDTGLFPDYSWRGFAIFSKIQDEVHVNVEVRRPSLYRLVFRYVNSNPNSITADVFAQPEASSTDVEQTSTVLFEPTGRTPQFVTVAGSGYITSFVLNPGRWTISLKTPERLLVDYLVLLPQNYYESSVLQDRVNRPCTVPATDALCKHFTYVDVSTYPSSSGEDGYLPGSRDRTQLFPDRGVSQELGTNNMGYLDNYQRTMVLDLYIPRTTRYIVFVQYHSPMASRKQNVDVTIDRRGRDGMDGTLRLPGCPYSSLCRQVIVDGTGDAQIFDLEQGTYQVTLNSRDPDTNLGVESIVAVPYDEWNLYFLQPQLKCVRRDKQCIGSDFLSPTGSVRAEVETGPNEDRVSDDIPPSILDTSIRVIKLDGRAPTVNVKASVINPGPYAFVVHYFQPYISTFKVQVEVLVDNVPYKGEFDASYCPGVSGCRSRVTFPDVTGDILDLSDLDFLVSFNNTSGKPVWLDYIMVIPAVQYRPDVLTTLPVDKSSEFIKKCGSEDFYISEDTHGFCRDGVFSLTTDYNNGALNCECNIDGSTNFNCNQFGGQCNCKANVIGRTCSQCRTGYYGFPNCRPCNCPSGLCDPQSGKCVCPPRVTGPNCNVCLSQTFGFDPLIGCEECNCDSQGVMNRNMECDITTGQCSCKANIGGRRCDQCVPGYSYFPRCVPCSCDRKGTTDDVCDQDSAQCLCKENVQGVQCSQCRQATFYLEDRNPRGCTKCFCFGTTQNCQSSSTLRRAQVQDMRGWGITNLNMPMVDIRGNTLEATVNRGDINNPDQPIYWVAPLAYLGNKITSYGGNLIYTVAFRLPRNEPSSGRVFTDVRIEGANLTISHISPEQPVPGTPLTVVLDMIESKFLHDSSGAVVSREQFMMVLSYIDSIQIRANYYSVVNRVSLSDVSLDIATETGSGALARNVEQCRCPPNYKGTSCEQCADGYYRSKTGPFLGVCVPCQCNNKADTCDPDTGSCVNCRENYGGPQCLTCKPGYFTDRYGTCTICSCPMPIDSNNFADTCSQRSNGLFDCQCKTGYTGRQCDTCDLGYYGNPTEIGGECRPCDCSGNININDPTSCDPINGQCLKCSNNTAGERCERCQDWWWGDAIDLKNCQSCICNQVGTEQCNDANGACLCKPGVVGATCDRCMRGMYGFDSGYGCSACDCAEGSVHFDCDVGSGQCQCQRGVTGRRCDQCEQGYWSYGPLGCEKCECESDGATTCDPRTGQCQCLPGVTGPKCDMCLPRWVLVPEKGCQECDSCIDILLDELEMMNGDIANIMDDLDTVSVGVGAIRRLEAINASVIELRPRVDGLIVTPQDTSLLDPYKRELMELEDEASRTRKRADKLNRAADLVETDAATTRADAEALQPLVDMAVDASDNAVKYAQEILDEILNSKEASDLENMLRQAETMLTELKDRDFGGPSDAAEMELDKAVEALNNAKSLHDQAMEQANRTRDLGINVGDISDKLRDLMNNSRHALDNAQAANNLNQQNKQLKDNLQTTIKDINDKKAQTEDTLAMARDLVDNARLYLGDARVAYHNVSSELSRLDPATDDLRDFVDNLTSENLELRPLVDNATEHARKLRQQAEFLDSMIEDTRASAEGGLNASNAYQAIVDAINEALNASGEANTAGQEALDLSNGLAIRAEQSYEKSKELKSKADETAAIVAIELQPRMDAAVKVTDNVQDLNQKIRDELDRLNGGLDLLPEGGYEDAARAAAEKAEDAEIRASAARDTIQTIVDQLPDDEATLQQIPYDIGLANTAKVVAMDNADKVMKLVPEADALLNKLDARVQQVNKLGEDLTRDINALRERIGLARGEANRINVGAAFTDRTFLQLRNPANLMSAGSFSKLSVYFRTDQDNGFLAYVGPDGQATGQKQMDDFMALEIVGGQVVYKVDLGTGLATVTNPKSVSDGMWHHAIAQRIGKNLELTVRTNDENDVVANGQTEGAHIVLDLDPTYTRYYVGGAPDAARAYLSSRGVQSQRFQGCLENVEFDGVQVGLWNFVSQDRTTGCTARDGLEVAPPKGFQFSGDGYMVMSKDRYRPIKSTSVEFKFRTHQSDGLLLLMGNGTLFLSVELKDGRILFQYDLGLGPAVMLSEGDTKYNDGKWHTVNARRINTQGLLKIDGENKAAGKSPGVFRELVIDDMIFIGGYKGEGGHPYNGVTQTAYQGCLKDLHLGSDERNMNENLFAYRVQPGCVETARSVSFIDMGGADGYIALNRNQNVGGNYQMTLKFKSENEDGLLFYVGDDQQSQENALSISIKQGKIVTIATVEGTSTVMETDESNYNDGRWHYISFDKQGRALQLHVDDRETFTMNYAGKRGMDTSSGQYIYFGGLPYRAADATVGSHVSYIGCIGDVTINGKALNFAEGDPSMNFGAMLGSCPIMDPKPPTLNITFPPFEIPTQRPDTGEESLRCALPVRPVLAPADPADGERFGIVSDSRWEFDNEPKFFREGGTWEMEFRTTASDGIMMYAADSRQVDFLGLYMKDGYIVYGFNLGDSPARISSTNTYNDGQWHKAAFKRNALDGELTVDDVDQNAGSADGSSQFINVAMPFYVGGVTADIALGGATNIEDLVHSFKGCIRNLKYKGVEIGEPDRKFATQSCSAQTESGTFIGADGGYVKLMDNMKVDLDLDVNVDIRPRVQNGVIFSVYGTSGDYLVMQLFDGELYASMNNGQGEVSAVYTPPIKNQLCNGQWHTIKCQKAKNVITLEVDGVFANPGLGTEGVSKTDTDDPFYIGGVPVNHPGIKSTGQYVGCIKNLEMNHVFEDISAGEANGDANLNSCPTV